MKSSFRAARDGVQASLLHDASLRPVLQITAEVLAQVRPHARARRAEAAAESAGEGGDAPVLDSCEENKANKLN
jgi:gamma-glutamyl:cysteine ligase YbdK (ATP-grasp superfamily)